jgi:hypothetical protein
MKIRLTDDRGIFLDGKKRREGYEAVISDEDGQCLIDAGMAKQVHTRAKRKKAEDADDAVAH